MNISLSLIVSIALLSLFTVSGCAVRPLPENVTRDHTYDIVQRIRCEVRDALRSYFRGALRKFEQDAIADKLKENPDLFRSFDKKARSKLPKKLQDILNRYDQGAVGYEFTFDMEENNTLDGGFSIGRIVTQGMFSLTANASADKIRQNKRNFIIIDNMEALVRYLDYDNSGKPICEYDADGSNIAYPVAGSLGLNEFVGTFFNLYEFGSLSQKPGADPKKATPSIFADTLTFTTTLSGDVGGNLTLNPIRDSAGITGADAKYTAKRVDKHILVIAITLPAEVEGDVPLSVSEQNARSLESARDELERQRLISLDAETSLIRKSLLNSSLVQ